MRSRALRAAAWTAVAVGIAAPLVRRRLRLPPPLVLTAAASAPFGLCVAVRRSPARDVATCVLQMWAYVAAYHMPHDDPDGLARRVHVDYPIAVDRVVGAGTLPTLRLQRLLARPGSIRRLDRLLIWPHWLWFTVPHSTLAYLLWRRSEGFPRAAALTYGVFDLGVLVYWLVPTAPPWYAAEQGRLADRGPPALRRMMAEYGEDFWAERWGPLYSFLGGNPLAAMPSLHFATSVMAAHLLTEAGPVQGALGWAYAVTLGVALVYLGEHYVVDLLAGLALTEGVRRAGPRAAPLLARISDGVRAVEARAHAA